MSSEGIKAARQNKPDILTVPPQRQRPYVPDLSSFMSLCDANYAKFMQLLPEFEQHDSRCFGLSRSRHELGKIEIRITERCKYTSTLSMTQIFDYGGEYAELMEATNMEVRLYHDARMAEVLSFQGVKGIRANYTYPNQNMLQKDEKALCNEFLADWLSYCLRFGHSHEQAERLDHPG